MKHFVNAYGNIEIGRKIYNSDGVFSGTIEDIFQDGEGHKVKVKYYDGSIIDLDRDILRRYFVMEVK